MEKIKMTEEQRRDFFENCISRADEFYILEKMKEGGYIKKSDLEIAKENYVETLLLLKDSVAAEYIWYIQRYISGLEEKISKLES